MLKPHLALTIRSNGGPLRELLSECHVCAAFDPAAVPIHQQPKFEPFRALWDTGASATAIDRRVVDRCQLKPIGIANSSTANGVFQTETYLINVRLPSGVAFQEIVVTRAELGPRIDVLVGMDIITVGDFSITNVDGHTVFSFRAPSLATIDYVAESHAETVRVTGSHPIVSAPPGKPWLQHRKKKKK